MHIHVVYTVYLTGRRVHKHVLGTRRAGNYLGRLLPYLSQGIGDGRLHLTLPDKPAQRWRPSEILTQLPMRSIRRSDATVYNACSYAHTNTPISLLQYNIDTVCILQLAL